MQPTSEMRTIAHLWRERSHELVCGPIGRFVVIGRILSFFTSFHHLGWSSSPSSLPGVAGPPITTTHDGPDHKVMSNDGGDGHHNHHQPFPDPYSRSRYHDRIDSKIVVMGNSGAYLSLASIQRADLLSAGVGKTSLLQRYTQNTFDPRNTTSTSGAFFVPKKVDVNGVKVRLQLWDTAGQERFRSLVRRTVQLFLSSLLTPFATADTTILSRFVHRLQLLHALLNAPPGANAALLLYDITNLDSFQDVRGWLEGNAGLIKLLTTLAELNSLQSLKAFQIQTC